MCPVNVGLTSDLMALKQQQQQQQSQHNIVELREGGLDDDQTLPLDNFEPDWQ